MNAQQHAQQREWVRASFLLDPRPAVRHDVYVRRSHRSRSWEQVPGASLAVAVARVALEGTR